MVGKGRNDNRSGKRKRKSCLASEKQSSISTANVPTVKYVPKFKKKKTVKEPSERTETNVDNQSHLKRKKGEKKDNFPCKEIPELMSNDVKVDVPDKNIGITANTNTKMEICLDPVKTALSGTEVNKHESKTMEKEISTEQNSENEPGKVESINITQMYDCDNNTMKHNHEHNTDDPSALDNGMDTDKENKHLIKRKNTGSVENDFINFNDEVEMALESQIIKTDDVSKKPFAGNKELKTGDGIKQLEMTGATHGHFLTNSVSSSQIIVPPASELVQPANNSKNAHTSDSGRWINEESAIEVMDAIIHSNMERTGHSDYIAAQTSVEVNDEVHDAQDVVDGQMPNAPFDLQYPETSDNVSDQKSTVNTINEIKSIKKVKPHAGDSNQISESTGTQQLQDTEDETITEDEKMKAPGVEMTAISNIIAERTEIQSNQIPNNKTKTITEDKIINVPSDIAVMATDISGEDQVSDIQNIQSIDSRCTTIGDQVINMSSSIEKTRLPIIITDDCVPLSADVKETIANHTNNIAKDQMISEPSSVEINNLSDVTADVEPTYTAHYGSQNTKSDIENLADQIVKMPSIEMTSIADAADDKILGPIGTAVQDIPITVKDTSTMPSVIGMTNLFDAAKPRVLDPTDTNVQGFQITDNDINTAAEQQTNEPSGVEIASPPVVVTDDKKEVSKACDTDVRVSHGATLEDLTDNIHMESISSSVPNFDAEEQLIVNKAINQETPLSLGAETSPVQSGPTLPCQLSVETYDSESWMKSADKVKGDTVDIYPVKVGKTSALSKSCDQEMPTEDNKDQPSGLQQNNTKTCDQEKTIEDNEDQFNNIQQIDATKNCDQRKSTWDIVDQSSSLQQIDATKKCDPDIPTEDNMDQYINLHPCDKEMPTEGNEGQSSNHQQRDATKKSDQAIPTEDNEDHSSYNCQQIDATEMCDHEMPAEDNEDQFSNPKPMKRRVQEMPIEDDDGQFSNLQQIDATKKFDQEMSTENNEDHSGNLQQIGASESCDQEMPIEDNQDQSCDHQQIDVTKRCDQETPIEDNQEQSSDHQQIDVTKRSDQEMPIEDNQDQSSDHQQIDKRCDQEMPVEFEDYQDHADDLQQIEAEMLEITNSQICQMELEYSTLEDLSDNTTNKSKQTDESFDQLLQKKKNEGSRLITSVIRDLHQFNTWLTGISQQINKSKRTQHQRYMKSNQTARASKASFNNYPNKKY